MADKYPEIFVLRHGQTEWNRVGRFQGRLDSPLTEKGQGQALVQSGLLADAIRAHRDIDTYCSPQGRAVNTAAIALAPLGMVATQDHRLCEIAFGKWEALTFDEIAKGWPEHMKYADTDPFEWSFNAPGGESFEDIRARVEAFLDSLTGPTIIVTHGITSRVLRGVWMGQGWNGTSGLPGGQGCVYHLRDGQQVKLER